MPSNCRSGHLAAFVRAALALVRAALAVVHLVLSTLGTARITDVGTEAANLLHELRPTAHISRRRKANLGTISIEPNAPGHPGDVAFAQAGIGAMLTLLGAA